jgi:hypothetical protein
VINDIDQYRTETLTEKPRMETVPAGFKREGTPIKLLDKDTLMYLRRYSPRGGPLQAAVMAELTVRTRSRIELQRRRRLEKSMIGGSVCQWMI